MTPGQYRGPLFANFDATPGATNIDMLVYASAVILLDPNDHCTENSLATPPMVSINAVIADTFGLVVCSFSLLLMRTLRVQNMNWPNGVSHLLL